MFIGHAPVGCKNTLSEIAMLSSMLKSKLNLTTFLDDYWKLHSHVVKSTVVWTRRFKIARTKMMIGLYSGPWGNWSAETAQGRRRACMLCTFRPLKSMCRLSSQHIGRQTGLHRHTVIQNNSELHVNCLHWNVENRINKDKRNRLTRTKETEKNPCRRSICIDWSTWNLISLQLLDWGLDHAGLPPAVIIDSSVSRQIMPVTAAHKFTEGPIENRSSTEWTIRR